MLLLTLGLDIDDTVGIGVHVGLGVAVDEVVPTWLRLLDGVPVARGVPLSSSVPEDVLVVVPLGWPSGTQCASGGHLDGQVAAGSDFLKKLPRRDVQKKSLFAGSELGWVWLA